MGDTFKKLSSDLQKIDSTIQEVVNPYKTVPNISEDDDSRTVICVYRSILDGTFRCKVLVRINREIGGFAWTDGLVFLKKEYSSCFDIELYCKPKSKIYLMKIAHKLYNEYLHQSCIFYICDTNKANQIVRFIYHTDKTYYYFMNIPKRD